MLDCSSTAEFPVNDPGKLISECGSQNIQNAFIGYFVALMIAALILGLSTLFPTSNDIRMSLGSCYTSLQTESHRRYFPNTYLFYVRFMEQLRFMAMSLSLFIVGIFMPAFLTVKITDPQSKMMTFQYWWLPSIAFIQGGVAIPAVLTCFIALILFSTGQFYRLAMVCKPTDSSHAVAKTDPPVDDTTTVRQSISAIIRGKIQQGISRGMAIKESRNQNRQSHVLLYATIYILVPSVNLIIMAALNYGYLTTQLHSNYDASIAYGAVLAGFKVFWNTIVVSYTYKLIFTRYSQEVIEEGAYKTGAVALQTFLILINNVFIPIAVNMFVNPSCFSDLVTAQEQLTVSVPYPICTFYGVQNGLCLQAETFFLETTFTPPFIYSAQCGSALLKAYIPLYVAMYSYLTFINPLMTFAMIKICEQYDVYDREFKGREAGETSTLRSFLKAVMTGVPKIYFPASRVKEQYEEELVRPTEEQVPHTSTSDCRSATGVSATSSSETLASQASQTSALKKSPFRLHNNANVTANFFSNFIALLSFGSAYPPLAFLIALAIIVQTFELQILVGRFLFECDNPTRKRNRTTKSGKLTSVISPSGEALSATQKSGTPSTAIATSSAGPSSVPPSSRVNSLPKRMITNIADESFPFTPLEEGAARISEVLQFKFGLPILSAVVLSAFYAFFLHDMYGYATTNIDVTCVTVALLPPVVVILSGALPLVKKKWKERHTAESAHTGVNDTFAATNPTHDGWNIESDNSERCEL